MAVAVLKLAAELHPDSWNAFDSLGEAHTANTARTLPIGSRR